ncbi:sulfatase [Puteibacter caeruleilacunae]|nr:sulfatase [Puteibacter caeruleilacunae]
MITIKDLLKKGTLAGLAGVSLLSSCSIKEKESVTQAPNIIYILADDMGYGDVSALNSMAKVKTPALDQIVHQGVHFTDAHTNSAVCTPTRYGILTGRYCFRSRLKSGVLVGHEPSLIESGRETVASLLKANGYHTGCVGKWHLGLDWKKKDESKPLYEGNLWNLSSTDNVDYAANVDGGPNDHGFDYGYIIPASLDIAPYTYIENEKVTAPVTRHVETWRCEDARGMWYRHGDTADDFKHEDVLSQLTNKAVGYINKQAKGNKPFFLYFPLTAPHTPWLPSKEFRGKSGAGVYGDFVMMVDNTVQQVLDAVKQNGIDNNTIIVFTSDNGSHWLPSDIKQFGHEANVGRIGMKSDAWDGGHRVPFLVRWPEKVKAGTSSDEVICTTDLLATCADIVGANLANNAGEDSYSFLPVLLGKKQDKTIREATIHHSIGGTFAIRKGDWKFIDAKGSGGWSLSEKKAGEDALPGQLFNMKEDPKEQNNLYAEKPELVKELKALIEKYKSQGYSRPLNK